MSFNVRHGLGLALAAALARLAPVGVPARAPKAEPRTERFFDRPFPCLVKCRGVLVPVRLAVGEGRDGRAARAAVERDARAMTN